MYLYTVGILKALWLRISTALIDAGHLTLDLGTGPVARISGFVRQDLTRIIIGCENTVTIWSARTFSGQEHNFTVRTMFAGLM